MSHHAAINPVSMRRMICLIVVSLCMYVPNATSQNSWGATVSYGVGELKSLDSKTMAHITSWGLSYEIGLRQRYGLSFGLRRGSIRTNQLMADNSVFVTDQFVELVIGGRRYYPLSNLSTLYGGVQVNGRLMYNRDVETSGSDQSFSNIGSTYGIGAFAGIRTVVSPKTSLDITLGENYDFAKSFKKSEHEFRINQVYLNVGMQISL